MRGLRGEFAVGLLLATALLSPSGAAAAGATCKFQPGSAKLSVNLRSDSAMRMAVVGAEVQPQDAGGAALTCTGGPATVTTTDRIVIKAPRRKATFNSVVFETPASYAPGATPEPGLDADEIEIKVALGKEKDTVLLLGTGSAESMAAGTAGINLNAGAEPLAADVDMTLKKVENFNFLGGGGDDTFDGRGGGALGSAFDLPMQLSGDNGDDTLTGGRDVDSIAGGFNDDGLSGGGGNDSLIGAPGDDDLDGGGGDDDLSGSAGADVIGGGAGVDTATYNGGINGSPVIVDIGVGGANDGGPGDGPVGVRDDVQEDVENLTGGPEVDLFEGTFGANVLIGGEGADELYGLPGKDLLKAKDGVADTVIDCGDGKDRTTFDAGLDPPRTSC